MRAITGAIVLKIANLVINSGLLDKILQTLAEKLDHTATTLCDVNHKLEDL
jgi:hypothetical protein